MVEPLSENEAIVLVNCDEQQRHEIQEKQLYFSERLKELFAELQSRVFYDDASGGTENPAVYLKDIKELFGPLVKENEMC